MGVNCNAMLALLSNSIRFAAEATIHCEILTLRIAQSDVIQPATVHDQ